MMSDLDPRHSLPPLSAVLESMAASLGAADLDNHLKMVPAQSATLLLIDGLGAELVASHPDDAPHLNAAALDNSTTVAAGFPATTAVSLTSLATGRPSGTHGILGYTFRAGAGGLIPEAPILNSLRWCVHGNHDHSLIKTVVPEDFQTTTTIFEKCHAQGFATRQIVPGLHIDSGLSRAALRGAAKVVAAEHLDDLRASILAEMSTPAATLGYAYYGGLDLAGHLTGPGSEPWREQLRLIDAMVGELAEQLPAGRVLVITGDHGMVDTSAGRFDIDLHNELTAGTTAIAGEARVRHVYAKDGAAEDVHEAWQTMLADRATVLRRDDAIDAAWFGQSVRGNIRVRIGDVVAAARGDTAMIRSVAEPLESTLVGNHGSWDSAEQLVPAIVIRGLR